jgi:hypothetical protein
MGVDRTGVLGSARQYGKELYWNPISVSVKKDQRWLGAVVQIYNPSYMGIGGRKVSVQGWPKAKNETPMENY